MMRNNKLWLLLILCNLAYIHLAAQLKSQSFLLAVGGKAGARIVVTEKDAVSRFAASELQRYLGEISGADFEIIAPGGKPGKTLRLSLAHLPGEDAYRLELSDSVLSIMGGSPRALLYGVYDVLRQLGCRWPAPSFLFYNGSSGIIPKRDSLVISMAKPKEATPAFSIRKLDVEEGKSHTIANLLELIDWMPKLGFNTLMVPMNYGGGGRVKWDNWREKLTPALRKRGLLIEVGGHGYQNFLNASMEDSTLFARHPDWFGKDSHCRPSPRKHLVFNTADTGAVHYLIANVVTYLRAHPEIDLFDFWPPDGARWAECPELKQLGSKQDRQAKLANLVDDAIKRVRPGLKLEIIAYGEVLQPPEAVSLHPDILVDFCPINQSYEYQIDDSESTFNLPYVKALEAWRQSFKGQLGLYSYYRKYGWYSLPNVIPHYIAADLKWYAQLPLQAVSVYCEPGDWGTYSLNYYVLGRIAWEPSADVDSLIKEFCQVSYGPEAATASRVYAALERTVRHLGNIPFTTLKSPEQIAAGIRLLSQCRQQLSRAKGHAHDSSVLGNLDRLALAVEYAKRDLGIQQVKAKPALAKKRVLDMLQFLHQHADRGVFVVTPRDNAAKYLRHYGLAR